jgi:hypothetical protein
MFEKFLKKIFFKILKRKEIALQYLARKCIRQDLYSNLVSSFQECASLSTTSRACFSTQRQRPHLPHNSCIAVFVDEKCS